MKQLISPFYQQCTKQISTLRTQIFLCCHNHFMPMRTPGCRSRHQAPAASHLGRSRALLGFKGTPLKRFFWLRSSTPFHDTRDSSQLGSRVISEILSAAANYRELSLLMNDSIEVTLNFQEQTKQKQTFLEIV